MMLRNYISHEELMLHAKLALLSYGFPAAERVHGCQEFFPPLEGRMYPSGADTAGCADTTAGMKLHLLLLWGGAHILEMNYTCCHGCDLCLHIDTVRSIICMS